MQIVINIDKEDFEEICMQARIVENTRNEKIAQDIIQGLKNQPLVTPARKKSKWVTKYHGFPPEPYTACSNCDYDIDFEISKLVKADAFTIKPYRPKFCPNCGAEMENKECEAFYRGLCEGLGVRKNDNNREK